MANRSYVPRHAAVPEAAQESPRGTARAAAAVVSTLSVAAVVSAALAAPANAAGEFSVWNRVAHCESSGRWHIATGNGYYGGLQFSSGTWGAYGGHHYAHEASGASRLEQIEVARRVLHAQGPHAWPVCGPRAGLTRRNGHATGRRLPADADRAHQHAARHHHAVHHHAVHHHAVHHHARTHHADHHVRHHARHSAAGHPKYRVKSGDTLAKIAARHHVRGGWRHLYRLNRSRIHDPNVLYVGQILLLP
jgi:nucleoid-associated protein YgaU